MISGDAVSELDVFMDFEPYFNVHNLASVHPQSIILGPVTNLNMIFHVVVSVYWFVKTWNSPQFPAEFWNGQYHLIVFEIWISGFIVWYTADQRCITQSGI